MLRCTVEGVGAKSTRRQSAVFEAAATFLRAKRFGELGETEKGRLAAGEPPRDATAPLVPARPTDGLAPVPPAVNA
ncbi:protein of unknown function [Candidatus Filomicrobium marinum]|uniref:Uncharacterized protein n=1 Tax=Candidatus Filomicrobium marinum TaxID=1608628 RepID=A0A0D6JIM2_9HYPH|nr:protein of unknown function [Candidatus Filomicrobium marinum]CPR21808.1 protein of unknown function [Candidatus Filomicrobium marinum]